MKMILNDMITFLIFYYIFSLIVCLSRCNWEDTTGGKLMQLIVIILICPIVLPILIGDKLS